MELSFVILPTEKENRKKKKPKHFFGGNFQVSLVAALSFFLGRPMFTLVGFVVSV